MLRIKSFLLKILVYFRKINIYELKKNHKKIYFDDLELIEFNSIRKIKSKKIKLYLKTKNLFKRFVEKNVLLVLKKGKLDLAVGWKNCSILQWKISEINKTIFFKNKIILFDFWVFREHRNKGYYSKMLLLIKNINTKKKFIIYSLSNNLMSIKGILKANFKLKNIISKIND